RATQVSATPPKLGARPRPCSWRCRNLTVPRTRGAEFCQPPTAFSRAGKPWRPQRPEPKRVESPITRFCEANPARAANAALAKKERQLISRHTAQVFSGEGAALGHSEARSTLDSLKLVDSPHPLYSHEDLFI